MLLARCQLKQPFVDEIMTVWDAFCTRSLHLKNQWVLCPQWIEHTNLQEAEAEAGVTCSLLLPRIRFVNLCSPFIPLQSLLGDQSSQEDSSSRVHGPCSSKPNGYRSPQVQGHQSCKTYFSSLPLCSGSPASSLCKSQLSLSACWSSSTSSHNFMFLLGKGIQRRISLHSRVWS